MAENKSVASNIWKWGVGFFLLLLLLTGAAALYISAKWKPLLTEKIKEGVYNASHHLYKIDFKNIHLNLLLGSATLDSVTLTPDTAVFEALKKQKQAPTHLFQVKLVELRLSRAGILDAYFKKKLDINAIVLNRPSINMIYNKVAKRPDTVKDERTLYEQISKTLKLIRVRQIKIIDADFDYINGANGHKLNTVKHLNVNIDDFRLDSLSQYDTTRFYYTKDISFELLGYKSLTKDKMYTLKAESIVGSATGKSLMVKGLRMIPMYEELAFSRKYKMQKDRYAIQVSHMAFKGVDFIKLNQEGSLHTRSVQVGPGKVGIFMNRELPPPNFDKGRNYPQMALKRLSFPLHIDTLRLKNIDLAYTEYNPISQKKGTANLENLSGTVLNITNDSLQLSKNHHAIANLSTRIINAANLNVHLDLNLRAKNGDFTCIGHIGAMNMVALNPLSRSLGLVKIEHGKVQKADFNIQGNLQGSKGLVKFYYSSLKVSLLKEGEDGEATKKKGFLSFLANTIIIKDANPTNGKPLRVANVVLQRTPAASFFNLLFKTVFAGIRETIGIGMVPIKSPEKAFAKVEEKQQERREKRQKRKEDRIQKREDKAKSR